MQVNECPSRPMWPGPNPYHGSIWLIRRRPSAGGGLAPMALALARMEFVVFRRRVHTDGAGQFPTRLKTKRQGEIAELGPSLIENKGEYFRRDALAVAVAQIGRVAYREAG